MRILHVVTVVDAQASYGGALTVAVNQCIELRRRGHDARIAGGWGGPGPAPTRLEGVPVHLFRVRPVAPGLGFSGLYSRALLRWVRDHAPSFDVAHLHLARDLVPLSIAGLLQRLELPYVVQTHGALAPGDGRLDRLLDRRMTRRALLAARHVFALTLDERDTIARVAGTPANISLLPYGVVLPDRVPVATADGPDDVLFLGRLQPSRRVMAFAAAAERLLADGLDATFSVVGPDGGDLRQLRRFIEARPHLDGPLRYEGAMPHDRAVRRLRRADLYVLPSLDAQAVPMSLLEAMAAGVPSICTTACNLAGILAREQAAIVANPTDDALYGAMRRMLIDRAGRARLSARAASTAASVFSMATVAEALELEYDAGAVPLAGVSAGSSDGPQRVLWVTDRSGARRARAWDQLRSGRRLTVALLDDGSAATSPSTDLADLADRGYPVVRVAASGDRAPAALEAMVRDRPDVVILDGDRPRTWAAVTRWARWSGAEIVAAGIDDPVATAVRALHLLGAPGHAGREQRTLRDQDEWSAGTSPVRDIDVRGDRVIDLDRWTRSPGPPRG